MLCNFQIIGSTFLLYFLSVSFWLPARSAKKWRGERETSPTHQDLGLGSVSGVLKYGAEPYFSNYGKGARQTLSDDHRTSGAHITGSVKFDSLILFSDAAISELVFLFI